MATKKTRRTTKREQIIHAAEQLFTRFGAKRVTVAEICETAFVSKMTFYKYFANKVALVECIRDSYVEEGFQKFDEINKLEIPFAAKIDLMTQWKMEFGSRIGADFIQELVSIDDAVDGVKTRFLKNISDARDKGDVRDDIDPEFLWAVTEKIYELVKDDSWKAICTDFSQFQYQVRTLVFYGLLSRNN